MTKFKNLCIAVLLMAGTSIATAQENPDTSYWSKSGKGGITFSQVGLSNWAAGGEPSLALNTLFNFSLTYERENNLWQTVLDAGYGTQRQGEKDESFKKSADNLMLISRYGYKIADKWYASAMAEFRTQFTNGYTYKTEPETFVSAFMAPAYLKTGFGVTYNHSFAEGESFSFTFSPLNVKTTFVLDDTLSARGSYGVEPGKTTLLRGGMDLLLRLRKELIKNVTLGTTLTIFTPYEDMLTADVNWDLTLWFKINEWLSANINTQMIYDQAVGFTDDSGDEYFSAIQFKEVLGIGLAFSF